MSKRILMALLLCCMAFPAAATDYTDIWWNPAESGWGVNFAQNDRLIFATFFVYGPGNTPTWYTGQLSLVAGGSFTGPLYATTGTYLGTVPFNPAQTAATQAGNATFTPAAADTGVLTYNVGNAAVVKNIQRLTIAPLALSGSYAGALVVETSGCPNPAENEVGDIPSDVTVTQPGPGQIKVKLDLFLGIASCSFSSNGTVTQVGSLVSYPASYACGPGFNASARLYELRPTSLGIEGRWMSQDPDGCREEGRFSAVRK